MSVILWIVMICYLITAVIFNLSMLTFYKQEKDSVDSPWSGNEFCDKMGMVVASAIWPICLAYGLYKMYIKKEDN